MCYIRPAWIFPKNTKKREFNKGGKGGGEEEMSHAVERGSGGGKEGDKSEGRREGGGEGRRVKEEGKGEEGRRKGSRKGEGGWKWKEKRERKGV